MNEKKSIYKHLVYSDDIPEMWDPDPGILKVGPQRPEKWDPKSGTPKTRKMGP